MWFGCVIVADCGELSNPNNGLVFLTGTLDSSQATYNCSVGYLLVGNVTRICASDGQWTGYAPLCNSRCKLEM